MVRFKKFPIKTKVDKVYYSNNIVEDVVRLSVTEIPNVKLFPFTANENSSNGSCIVNIDKDGVRVDVAVAILSTLSISETAFKIQEAIRHSVESTTDYHVVKVNVKVCDVYFEEEAPLFNQEDNKN